MLKPNNSTLNLNGNSEFDYLSIPFGHLEIHIENTDCFDDNDKLTITHAYHELRMFSDLEEFDSYDERTYNGCGGTLFINDRAEMGVVLL